jgi:CRP-like cAMP-binding protein
MTRIVFDKEQLLGQHALLRHLSREQLQELAATTLLDNFQRGQTIFQKGDPGDSMMAVIRGRVKICSHSPGGKELVLNIIPQGAVFGEIGMLDGEPRTADAIAMEETDLLVLERAKFLPFIERHPDIALRMVSVLCERLRNTSEHLEDAMFLEAPARLARSLERLGESFGKASGNAERIDLKLSQSQLGAIVGLSRESVNKILGEWEELGYVKRESGIITILNREALEDIALGVKPD